MKNVVSLLKKFFFYQLMIALLVQGSAIFAMNQAELIALQKRVLSSDLFDAASDGDDIKVAKLLEFGVSPCIRCFIGWTPYDYAVLHQRKSTSRILLQAYVLQKIRDDALIARDRIFCLMLCFKRVGKITGRYIAPSFFKLLCIVSVDLGKELAVGSFFKELDAGKVVFKLETMLGSLKTAEILEIIMHSYVRAFSDSRKQTVLVHTVVDEARLLVSLCLKGLVKLPPLDPQCNYTPEVWARRKYAREKSHLADRQSSTIIESSHNL